MAAGLRPGRAATQARWDAATLVLNGTTRAGSPAAVGYLRDSLHLAGHRVFAGIAVVSSAAVLALLLMPRHTTQIGVDG